jgi:hypothetical protein
VIGGLQPKVKAATLLATGQPIDFEQTEQRLVLRGLTQSNPDRIAGVSVIRLECDAPPRQVLRRGCVVL